VGNEKYVFNIRGNNYRLVVIVIFIAGVVNIDFVGTHNPDKPEPKREIREIF
jgi:mRNA interferase HigB